MSNKYDFDYIIIGSGPAGRTVATKLASNKKKVAIVEADDFGGAELNTRDLPYEISLNFVRSFSKFVSSPAAAGSSPHFNLPTLIATRNQQITDLRNLYIKNFQELGIAIFNGFAHFLDNHTIAIEDAEYTADRFILASGSDLKASEISGLDSVDFLTPDDALNIHRLPKFIFIAGGGPTGVQLAEYFALLGCGVIIMERGSHLLPKEDEEVGAAISKYFTEVLGITVITDSKVVAITEDYTSKIVVFMDGTNEKMVRVESIVLATGSEPITDYGLENAGVDFKRTGIIVDKYFNTTAKNISAVGDCINDSDSSSERACLEANILANNLIHRQKFSAKYTGIIRSINTHPEIATVGMNEYDATARDLKYKKSIVYLKDIPSVSHAASPYDFVKILASSDGHLIGATIVAPNAKSIIQELALILVRRLNLESILETPHPLDTPAAAIPVAVRKLLTK
ncbi:NAD(P)/FAD-dependent oxidoreductase [Candidatus Saccharibacteria bacterium]|nr:NAD(P)/FAD-dependent oxidoreductase [Candidatus Saccharibacteria bacterium]